MPTIKSLRGLPVRTRRHGQALMVALRGDAPFYAAIAAYGGVCLAMLAAAGRLDLSAHANYLGQWTYLFLCMMPLLVLAYETLRILPRMPGGRMRLLRARVFSPARIARLLAGMAMMMGLMVFQGSFTSIKNLLPVLQGGFPYDRLHADIDDWLHFGHAPWELLGPLLGAPPILTALEWNYNVFWFLVCFGGLFLVVTSPGAEAVRHRYLAMFLFVWVVCGNVMAGLFLSAGPAFYGAVTGDAHRFAALFALIAASDGPSSALRFQTYLWMIHEQGAAGFGSGISAFPSVHVAMAAMNALFLAERSRALAVIGALYTLVILASSVLLGWHYAIDGYVSILAVAAAHAFLRRCLRAEREACFSGLRG